MEFNLNPLGIRVSRMDRVKHNAPHGSISSSEASSSEYSSLVACLCLLWLTLFCVMSSRTSRRVLRRLLLLSSLSCFLFSPERLRLSSLLSSSSSGELGSLSGVHSRVCCLVLDFLGAEAAMASFLICKVIDV